MQKKRLEQFIEKYATPTDTIYYYSEYSKKIKEMLSNIYNACWRMNLYPKQIMYLLSEALKPFEIETNLLGDLEE